jgi:nuclear GTP-binding protein
MVAKQAKSKRLKARTKYKIIRKVNEHHRKQRKENKNKPRKKQKDIKVPNSLPFKEDLIMESIAMKNLIEEEKKARKAALAEETEIEPEQIEQETSKVAKMHVEKIAYKHFQEVIDESDVLLYTLDKRDPLNSFDSGLVKKNKSKKFFLLMNVDLDGSEGIIQENVKAWKNYFKKHTKLDLFTQKDIANKLKSFSDSNIGIVGFPSTDQLGLLNFLWESDVKVPKYCGLLTTSNSLLRNQSKKVESSDELLDKLSLVIQSNYGLLPVVNKDQLLVELGRKRNYIRKKGKIDTDGIRKFVLGEYFAGNINYLTVPPGSNIQNEEDNNGILTVSSLGPVDIDYYDEFPHGFELYQEENEMEAESGSDDDEMDDFEEDDMDEESQESDMEEIIEPEISKDKKKKKVSNAKSEKYEFSEYF